MIDSSSMSLLLTSIGVGQLKVDENRGEITGTCPMHDDHKPSFSVSLKNPGHPFNCFKCGGGTLVKLIVDVKECSYKDSLRYILQFGDPDLKISEVPVTSPFSKVIPLPAEKEKEVLGAFSVWEAEGLDYLKKRGIPPLCQAVRGSRVLWDRIEKRIVFPWFWEDKYYGYSFRSIREKYRGTPVNKRLIPYSPTGIIQRTLVIVEGEIDAIKVSLAYPSVIACGSSKPSTDLLKRLWDTGVDTLYYFFDRDAAGVSGLSQTILKVEKEGLPFRQFQVPYVSSSDCKDPGDMDPSMIKLCLSRAKSVAELQLSLPPTERRYQC